jgi:hypothetical protein
MTERVGMLIEIASGDERGWMYSFDAGLLGCKRVFDAGGGQPERLRAFGESDWAIRDSRSPQGRSKSRSLLGRLKRQTRTPSGDHPSEFRLIKDSTMPKPSQFTLWAQILTGELTIERAEEVATGLPAGGDITDRGIDEASVMAKQLAHSGQPQNAVLLSRLAYATANGPAAGISERTRVSAAYDLIETAKMSLEQVPDPKLLVIAKTAGDAALAWAREHNEPVIVEMATFRLGALHLDPYQHSPETYWFEHKAWLRRGMAAAGTPPSDTSEEDLRAFMPMPGPALRTAEGYLRQAVAARSGEYRGFALKALVNTLVQLRGVGEDVDEEEIVRAATEAARLLPEDAEEPQRYVRQFLPKEVLNQLPDVPSSKGSTIGQSNEAAALSSAALAAAGTDPEVANRLVEARRELLAEQQSEWSIDQLILELRVAIRNTVEPTAQKLESWPGNEQAQHALRIRLVDATESPAVKCAVLLDLALQSTQTGTGPIEALECIDAALAADGMRMGLRAEVVDLLRGLLWNDRAGELRLTASEPSDVTDLAIAYSRATHWLHRGGQPALSVESLSALTPLFPLLPGMACLEVLSEVTGTTLGLGDLADPETDRVIQMFFGTALGHLLSGGLAHPELVLHVANLSKGTRLASALALGRRSGLTIPADLAAHLQRAEGEEADLVVDGQSGSGAGETSAETGEWLLLSYADTVEQVHTDTPMSRLRARQRKLDQHLNRLLGLPGRSLELSIEGVRKRLGPHSMLAVQMPVRWRTGSWGTCWLLVTRSEAHLQFVDNSEIGYGDLTVEVAGRTVRSSPDMALMESLRDELQRDPEADLATDDALMTLDGNRRLGDLWYRLEEALDAGHKHLIVAPHGPGHYLPWHLLGDADVPLADRCTVTILPNLGLLAPGTYTDLAMRLQHSGAASFGLSYRTVASENLGQLDHAEEEATEVASVLGIEPILEQQATVAAVIDALQTTRYVHLAAHGRHNADAPAFQAILLAGSPSRLSAHRLSAGDFRGLQLVTLGACETGLGRFDRADNLRGIPAALMLGGVRSIVATLWKVPDAASRTFFTALYRELAGSDAGIIGAFRAAQQATREGFPAYRDWGGFVLMGGLDETYSAKEES